jgi:hypothetical protein
MEKQKNGDIKRRKKMSVTLINTDKISISLAGWKLVDRNGRVTAIDAGELTLI